MKEYTKYKMSVVDKVCKRMSVFMLVTLFIGLFPTYVKAQTDTIATKTLGICSSQPLMDLNKAMGIAFTSTMGKWYESDTDTLVSNIYPFPSPAKSEYQFYFLVDNAKASCQLSNGDLFILTIKMNDVEIPGGNPEQFLCYLPDSIPTLKELDVVGDNVRWYDMETGGAPLPLNTELNDGATYYVSNVRSGCGESLERLAITVGVGIQPDLNIEKPLTGDITFDLLDELIVEDLNNSGGDLSYFTREPDSITDVSGLLQGNQLTLTETQSIYVLMTTPIGCYDLSSVEVIVNQDLIVPNGFSPNGDGANDFFVINGVDRYPENRLIIFNRWEKIVYQAKNYQNNWDGKAQGGLKIGNGVLPEGTYYYVLKLSDEIPVIKGFVYLKH